MLTGIVAARRLLDLDHVGAQVRKQHGGGGPCEDASEVDDLDTAKGWRHPLACMRRVCVQPTRRTRDIADDAGAQGEDERHGGGGRSRSANGGDGIGGGGPGRGSGPRARRVTFGRGRVSSRRSSAPERLRLPAIHPCPLPPPSPPGALLHHAFSSCPPQAASAGPWPAASARGRAIHSPFPRNCCASVAKRPLREWHERVLRRGDVQALEARPKVCTRLLGRILLWHGEGPA